MKGGFIHIQYPLIENCSLSNSQMSLLKLLMERLNMKNEAIALDGREKEDEGKLKTLKIHHHKSLITNKLRSIIYSLAIM